MENPQFTQNQAHSVIYGFGVIGSLVYFIRQADTIWTGIIGIIEAIFWPAVIVYKVFEYFKL